MMTLEQFVATGRDCDDLGAAIESPELWEDYTAVGRLYLDSFFIEKIPAVWPSKPEVAGKWYLIIERDEWISDDLAELEKHLYDFAALYEAI